MLLIATLAALLGVKRVKRVKPPTRTIETTKGTVAALRHRAKRREPGAAAGCAEDSSALVEGPWTHRTVRANGIALHVAELGTGPLVLFLHGFPQFWWACASS